MKKVEVIKAPRPSQPPLKRRRKFDAAFKREAVALWLSSGKSAREIGEELGLTERHLHSWHNQYAPATPTQRGAMEEELAALRRENVLLRQQRDILKKTLGILSEPPNSATNGSMR
jgi:transposase